VAICADSDVRRRFSHRRSSSARSCGASAANLAAHRIRDSGTIAAGWGAQRNCHTRRARAFQLHNASAALAALDVLKDRLPVSMEAVRRGLVEVRLAGRFQFVPGKPALILDVAHNPHAARSLAQNLSSLPLCPHIYAVFAMLKDKDIAGVVAALDAHIDTLVDSGHRLSPSVRLSGRWNKCWNKAGVRGEIRAFSNIAEALRYAYNAAGENDRILAFGSFYTVAEVMVAAGLRVA